MAYTEDTFRDHIIDTYRPYQSSITRNMEGVNKTQQMNGFSELFDITIRCTNANMRAIRFFKKHKMNYYDDSLTNTDRPIMLAVESYIYSLCEESKKELNDFIIEMNEVSDKILNSISFKLYRKYAPKLARIKRIDYDTKSKYAPIQGHLKKYNEIAEEITNFEVETDIYKAIRYYLPFLYKNMSTLELVSDPAQNLLLINKLFDVRVLGIINSLKECELTDEIETIIPLAQALEYAELEKRQKEYLEKEKVLSKTKR